VSGIVRNVLLALILMVLFALGELGHELLVKLNIMLAVLNGSCP
jgi:hypothetical protein